MPDVPDSPEACAARGAARIDRIKPDWVGAIDQINIDMSSSTECILGQVFGSYSGGLDALELDELDEICGRPEYYGFITDEPYSWDDLADAWRTEIRARREAEYA